LIDANLRKCLTDHRFDKKRRLEAAAQIARPRPTTANLKAPLQNQAN
jgi:hypothetical protein